ncbi:uncharacterized protein BDR25DRAFT_47045 [Lindgomyces ingoldianus]|uniref:Uncharacterized protein n=1 Tax=Lindgomyces ingoldianus TaxID=673940 RepID=A0ACB6QSX8_9PLEO|nr:uncharacterized protein BDR25DRAFT_47045 [Lindgomyces ingoldianus]KAF2469673.1 hypothetical protein BDR25DRAFT_47045 [Lindgomyces ingoldianus]
MLDVWVFCFTVSRSHPTQTDPIVRTGPVRRASDARLTCHCHLSLSIPNLFPCPFPFPLWFRSLPNHNTLFHTTKPIFRFLEMGTLESHWNFLEQLHRDVKELLNKLFIHRFPLPSRSSESVKEMRMI